MSSETNNNTQTISTPNDEQAALCSYCQEEVNDGIQCDDCRQWNHGECEGVNDRLSELYQMQEVPYICLSCRHLADEYFENDTGCSTLNMSLLDDSTMRDREVEDEPPQRDHVTVVASYHATPVNNSLMGQPTQEDSHRRLEELGKSEGRSP